MHREMGPVGGKELLDEAPLEATEEEVSAQHDWLDWALLASTQAPWWAVSISLHLLSIILISLISMSIGEYKAEENVVVCSVLEKQPAFVKDPVPDGPDTGKKAAKYLVTGTDETAKEADVIVIPPSVMKLVELGDHFETNNPDRPDTHSAFGNPDAHIFLTESGSDDKPGGGGNEGLALLDDVIGGPGEATSPGHGGGWGGGNGKGFGPDDGFGRGSIGDPNGGGRRWMVKRYCTPDQRKEHDPLIPVSYSFSWLAHHQEPDGHWDTRKYGSSEKTDTACTGLALLAFLGAGHTERVGLYKDNVRRAVAWLRSQQKPNGLVFDDSDAGAHRGVGYPHAIAAMALAEAAGMGGRTRVPETWDAAQKAVDYATKIHQQGDEYEKLGWRYQAHDAADLSVTGWYIMLLKSAKVAGLSVPTESLRGALKFLDSVEKKGQGGDKGYGPASVYWYQPQNEHGETAHRLTAIGTLARQFLGAPSEQTEATVRWYLDKGGVPDGWSAEKTDLYHWYYATMGTFLQQGESWTRWNAAMLRTLSDNQRKDGDDRGSWDPVGAFANEWGRVGQTALATLCLEVYYRYPCYMKK
jgi:hypothetical protein